MAIKKPRHPTDPERQPLLRSRQSSDASATTRTIAATSLTYPADDESRPLTKQAIFTTFLAFLIWFVFALADGLTDVGANEILEGILCRKHHGQVLDPIKDPRCKDAAVQSEFAKLVAGLYVFGLFPGILAAIPWGLAAEKYGRKPVLFLAILGMAGLNANMLLIYRFKLSVYWIWPNALITFIGGGPSVIRAILLTMLGDTLPPSYRANVYMYLGITPVLALMIQGPTGYELMKIGHWFTASVGIALYMLACILPLAMPETLHQSKHASVDDIDSEPSHSTNGQRSMASLWHGIKSGSKATIDAMRAVLLQDRTLALLTTSALFGDLGTYVGMLLMQYITKRLDLTWGEANLMQSIKSCAKLFLTFVLVPVVGHWFVRRGTAPVKKDLWIARLCAVTHTIGDIGIGFATSIPVFIPFFILYSTYNLYYAALQSVLATVAGEEKLAVVFSIVGWMENVGYLLAGPGMAWAYKIGLELGGAWLGLPFYLSGVLTSAVAVILFSVRLDYVKASAGT